MSARPVFQGPKVRDSVTTPEESVLLSAWLSAIDALDAAKEALKKARAEARRAEAAKRVATDQWRESAAGRAYTAAFDEAWVAHLRAVNEWEKTLPVAGGMNAEPSAPVSQ
jgi:hypothetical protein